MKILNRILVLLAVMLVFTACEKDEPLAYKSAAALNFSPVENSDQAYKATYSFLGNPDQSHIYEIGVQIMGDSANHDRNFQVKVIHDSLTTATENQYKILQGVVPAGQFAGTLSVELFKSPALDSTTVSIHLQIVDAKDFMSGNKESDELVLSWTNKVVVPNWRWYSFFFTKYPSTAAYRAVVASTGLIEFTISDYLAIGPTGAQALGTKFGDYVMEYNKQHPNNPLRHDDGPKAGELIVPLYYTHSKYD